MLYGTVIIVHILVHCCSAHKIKSKLYKYSTCTVPTRTSISQNYFFLFIFLLTIIGLLARGRYIHGSVARRVHLY